MRWPLVGLVFVGGGIGSVLRYLVALRMQREQAGMFPVATFAVNVVGCLLIGVLASFGGERLALSSEARVFLVVGLLGGFTTFSSFSFDTLALVRERHYQQALWNVAGQVGLSLMAVWAGFRLGLGR